MSNTVKQTATIGSAFSLAVIGIVLIIYFAFSDLFNDGSGVFDPALAANYGSFVGGLIGSIFALAGMLMLYVTILKQQRLFLLQQFESKYFELVRFHRKNFENISYKLPSSHDGKTVQGSLFFVHLTEEFDSILSQVNLLGTDFTKEEKISIAVLIHFHGVSKNARATLLNELGAFATPNVKSVIERLSEEKTAYDSNIVYFGGHLHRLGHYMRNLFQIVKLVHETELITDEQKYDYVKILRTQLTHYELVYFFYNSLGKYGKAWEELGYISDYKIIKHVHRELNNSVKPKDYYPNMTFEWESSA